LEEKKSCKYLYFLKKGNAAIAEKSELKFYENDEIETVA